MPSDPDDVLVRRSVAREMLGGISAELLYQLEADGKLDRVKLGSNPGKAHVFYKKSQIVALMRPAPKTKQPAPKRKRGGLSMFGPTTKVLLADHRWRRISSVKAGDRVVTYDEETNSFEEAVVERVVSAVRRSNTCLILDFATQGLPLHDEQQTFLGVDGGWLTMHDLDAGDEEGRLWVRPDSEAEGMMFADGTTDVKPGTLFYRLEVAGTNIVVTPHSVTDCGICAII
jgi:hypothetical protein